jgi:hypothetical protein
MAKDELRSGQVLSATLTRTVALQAVATAIDELIQEAHSSLEARRLSASRALHGVSVAHSMLLLGPEQVHLAVTVTGTIEYYGHSTG